MTTNVQTELNQGIETVKVGMDFEEGYQLTKDYVRYFWVSDRYFSLKYQYTQEDLEQELILKFLRLRLFEKYNPEVTSKKYYVMRAVQTSLIDLLRKQKLATSLEEENEEGLCMKDMLESNEDMARDVMANCERDRLINSLPDTPISELTGHSPLLGDCGISLRTIALHIEAGYSTKEISSMFINPKSGKPVSTSSVNSYISKLREFMLDNVILGY